MELGIIGVAVVRLEQPLVRVRISLLDEHVVHERKGAQARSAVADLGERTELVSGRVRAMRPESEDRRIDATDVGDAGRARRREAVQHQRHSGRAIGDLQLTGTECFVDDVASHSGEAPLGGVGRRDRDLRHGQTAERQRGRNEKGRAQGERKQLHPRHEDTSGLSRIRLGCRSRDRLADSTSYEKSRSRAARCAAHINS